MGPVIGTLAHYCLDDFAIFWRDRIVEFFCENFLKISAIYWDSSKIAYSTLIGECYYKNIKLKLLNFTISWNSSFTEEFQRWHYVYFLHNVIAETQKKDGHKLTVVAAPQQHLVLQLLRHFERIFGAGAVSFVEKSKIDNPISR